MLKKPTWFDSRCEGVDVPPKHMSLSLVQGFVAGSSRPYGSFQQPHTFVKMNQERPKRNRFSTEKVVFTYLSSNIRVMPEGQTYLNP
jgi:hypothetical protein